MKRLLGTLLSILFILPFSFILTSCKDETNFANLQIKNWANYESIGAGFVSNNNFNKKLKATSFSAESLEKGTPKLLGVTKAGTLETISFTSNGKDEVEQNLHLAGFTAFDNFIFVSYSKNKNSFIGTFNNTGEEEYVISKNGKIYYLNDIVSANVFTVMCYDESQDAMFFEGRDNNGSESYIYKLSIQNELLKLEKKLKYSSLLGFGTEFFVDKHGNIFSNNKSYIIKTNNTIEKLKNTNIYKSVNGLVYSGDMVFNSNGELEETDFVPENVDFLWKAKNTPAGRLKDVLIKKDNNVEYYYLGTQPDKIFKFTFEENKVNYVKEEIILEDYETAKYQSILGVGVYSNNKLFFLDADEVYYVNITTGSKTVINSSYLFNSIWEDKQGNICFFALNSSMDIVNGVINENDEVTLGITANNYNIVYISPIN